MEKIKKVKKPFKEGFIAIWSHVSFFKKEVILLIVLGLISAAANGAMPYITGRFFDALIQISQGTSQNSTFPIWASLLAIWAIIQLVANNIDWIIDRIRRSVDSELHIGIQARGFIKLLQLPLGFHKEHRVSEVIEKISHSSWRVPAVFRTIVDFAPQFLSVVVGVTLAYSISPLLASVLLIGVVVYILLLILILKPIAERDEQGLTKWSVAWGDGSATVQQTEAVKQAAAEEYEIQKINSSLMDEVLVMWKGLQYAWSNVNFFQRTLVFLTQLAVFLLSIKLVSENTITVGELIALNGYAQMFFGPFVTLGYSWEVIQNGLNSAKQVKEIFDEPIEIYKPKNAKKVDARGAVSFKKVSFGYDSSKTKGVLKDINFNVLPGEVIALVGESGVGKSTAVSLISGYFFPDNGVVLVDGVDTRLYNLNDLRRRIATVPQEISLFNDTIGVNIQYGSFEATQKEIEKAAEEAHIKDFIESLPEKYETVVGERGMKLSVGQKQRIAIARAILRDPSILILDEPTSALDAKTEQYITQSLEKLMKGRTTFIIAHRLSTVRRADKVLVFDKGEVVEEGTHESLMKIKNGVYRRLYEYQIGLHN